ncbi:MAG: hypothetical protein JWQ28_1667, partial [Pedobacter sp.]|nr:hypothetical protein [Pedobacter sp.]
MQYQKIYFATRKEVLQGSKYFGFLMGCS